jgi:hypothetical protein
MPGEPLTERELDVLRLIALGLTSAGIAVELGISEHTVKNYRRAAYLKLGVHSEVEGGALVRAAPRTRAMSGGARGVRVFPLARWGWPDGAGTIVSVSKISSIRQTDEQPSAGEAAR